MITIITATWNAAAHLRHCLGCVAKQRIDVEHLLIDGGSTDETLSIARQFPHIAHILSEPDHGIYDAMNKGLRLATGDIIGILNADDFYSTPDILVEVSKVFEDPEVEACYGDLVYVRESGGSASVGVPLTRPAATLSPGERGSASLLHEGEGVPEGRMRGDDFEIVRYWQSGPYDPQKFYHGWMPPHPTFFVRRSVYEKYGLFNLDLGTAADYELMLRFLLKYRIRCAYLPEVLVCMRVGGASNRSLSARLKANRMDRKAWEVNGLRPYPWTIPLKPLRKISQWWKRPK